MATNENKRSNALTVSGITLGVLIGVVLSLVLDSWAYMGVGVGIGLLMGGMPLFGRRTKKEQGPEEG